MGETNSSMTLLVGVCITKGDFAKHHQKLIKSFENITAYWGSEALFYVVLQGDSDVNHCFFNSNKMASNIEIYETNFMGVSRARNVCIKKARDLKVEFILFHDASIFWPLTSACFSFSHKDSDFTLKLKVEFSDFDILADECFLQNELHFTQDAVIKEINPIYDTYVWSYLFRVKFLDDIFFDEKFGPGQTTKFKSGEDVQFIFDYFSKVKSLSVLEASAASVYHPPRTTDYDKHLTYASGQGKTFRVLIERYPSFRMYVDLVLFFGNAIVRCLFFKKNSVKILRQRLVGFFDRGN